MGLGRELHFRSHNRQKQPTIGMPVVTASVFARFDWLEIIDVRLSQQSVGAGQITNQSFSFPVDVTINLVGDLSGPPTQFDRPVENRRPRPQRPAIRIQLGRLPKPHMMPLPGIVTNRLFKRQILRSAP